MTRARLVQALKAAFAVLAVGGLVAATVSQWSRVSETVTSVGAGEIAVGTLAMVAGAYLSMLSWRAILGDLGAPLGHRDATALFFVGQLGKYLPGSLWPVVAQMELGKKHAIPKKTSAVALLLAMLMGVTSGGLVAAGTLPFAAAGELRPYRYAFLVPALGLVLLHPAVFDRVSSLGLRLIRRAPLDRRLSTRGLATAMAWALLQWAVWGLAAAALSDHASYAVCLGAYALSWVAGFVVVVVPAGAGVREGAFVLIVGAVIGNGAAFGVALLLRLLSTVADLFWGLVAGGLTGHARFARVTSE
ncbi:MAG TPA: lysylphosphatidylglycerol synthase domain-containing protein [Frankiaceae bacterium]|nr:lysylphosphatidylglycerol synthase domain-containing protein [Frankiaceae bacterium]